MQARRNRTRTALLGLVGLVALAVGVAGYATDALRRPELSTVDTRFSVRGPEKPSSQVVMVGLDAKSLATKSLVKAGLPIPRRFHAQAIDVLREDGAKVIAYDFQFTQRTNDNDDGALIVAVDKAGNLVLGTTITNGQGGSTVLGGDGTLRRVGAVAGMTNYPASATLGGTFRRVPYANDGLRMFPVAAAQRASSNAIDRSQLSGDGAWIDFAGPAGTIPTISFSDLIAGKVPPADIKGKVVVVGATDPIAQDIHPAATDANMPGPEINANAIATILDGFPLQDAATWLALLFVALAALVTPASALRWTGLRWLPVPVVAAFVVPIVAQLAFNGGTVLPVVAPAVALLVAFLGTLAVAYATDVRERRHLRAAFGRFVPSQVVDEVVDQAGGDLRLGGTRRDATVLFCDLRGFTAAAEQLPAEQVIELLNHYLAEMSDALLDHGGTVVSYLGDGIMAVFGAPLAQADHADRAVHAAREMAGPRLAQFNAWVTEAGVGAPFTMGIGVCSGPVMSGNVGSARRLEYTAVGDTTNTASRLQGMTKDTGHAVLIAASTHALLRDADGPRLRPVGDLTVRGRIQPLTAWTLAEPL